MNRACRNIRHILLAAMALVLARMPGALAEPMQFLARPANGLALTPPMGWNSWNHFACNVSASLIEREADAMVASGMKAAGYRYVVIDDCWQVGRDANGNILADPQRFPQGTKAVADYVHAEGLKFGIFRCRGPYLSDAAGQPRARIPGRAAICPLGRRLSEI